MFTTGSRLELQELLETILGSSNVYFQPPESRQMEYPCIVYHRDSADTRFADDIPYKITKQYQVTVIAKDPDNPIPDKVAQLRLCTHSRYFSANNLHHDVFTLYY